MTDASLEAVTAHQFDQRKTAMERTELLLVTAQLATIMPV
jgi:hypothetical protein